MVISMLRSKNANFAARTALAALCVLGWPSSASAVVDLSMVDGDSQAVRISIKDPTRIRVEGDRIVDLVGAEIQSDGNPHGRLRVSANERGEVFVQPLDAAMPATSVFVSTGRETYTLVLAPAGIPADTIRIMPTGGGYSAAVERAETRMANHEKAVVMLLRDIAADRVPNFMQVVERNTPVDLWQQVDFTLIREYLGHPRWHVEAYLLTNTSAQRLVIDEREFVKRGVIAVGLEQADMAPGQSTIVRIVFDDEVR